MANSPSTFDRAIFSESTSGGTTNPQFDCGILYVATGMIESSSYSDTIQTQSQFQRVLLEGSTTLDVFDNIIFGDNTQFDLSGLSKIDFLDSVSRKTFNLRTITDSLAISDSLDRILLSIRTVVENITISDSIDRVLSSFRNIIENYTISDSLDRTESLFRNISENIGLSDSLARVMNSIRTMSENTSILDSITTRYSAIRNMIEPITIQDTISRTTNQFRTMTEIVSGLIDSISVSITRSMLESWSVSDGVIRKYLIGIGRSVRLLGRSQGVKLLNRNQGAKGSNR